MTRQERSFYTVHFLSGGTEGIWLRAASTINPDTHELTESEALMYRDHLASIGFAYKIELHETVETVQTVEDKSHARAA